MAYDAQGNWTAPRNADDRSRIYTDEEYALQRQRLQEQLAGMGIQLPPPDLNAPPPSRVRTGDLPAGDMHNPGWGIERPGDGAQMSYPVAPLPPAQSGTFPTGPIAPLPPAQSGTFPTHDAAGRAPGDTQWGTLGGAAGMGQPMSLYERGGGQSAYGGGPQAGGPYGMAPGGIGSSLERQSPTPYGTGRQSPTPYGMGRASPTPYAGSGYSTLGGMSGYGRRY